VERTVIREDGKLLVRYQYPVTLHRRVERVGHQYDVADLFFPQQQFHQLWVNVHTVGYHLALHVLLDEDRSDGTGVPMVKAAHRIEEMRGVQYPHLHALQDVFIGCVCMTRKQNDTLFDCCEG
jgi:hypothetical protein